jgi:ribosomal protein S18 acetylase RimI-like enzyme
MNAHRIRPATIDDLPALAAANIACWRETYGDLLPAEFMRGLENDPHYDEAHWRELLQRWHGFLVEAGEESPTAEIAGFVLHGNSTATLPGFDAQIEKLYLRKSAQGIGLGRALMRAAASDLLAQERQSLAIWVIDRNGPAIGFYRRLGGIRIGEPQSFAIAGVTLHEIAFGWPDLGAFLAAL